jgi:hypothetical protein
VLHPESTGRFQNWQHFVAFVFGRPLRAREVDRLLGPLPEELARFAMGAL